MKHRCCIDGQVINQHTVFYRSGRVMRRLGTLMMFMMLGVWSMFCPERSLRWVDDYTNLLFPKRPS